MDHPILKKFKRNRYKRNGIENIGKLERTEVKTEKEANDKWYKNKQ